ncbi:MAG: endonuclease/exonuclease/phosphatase family protein, partial [Fermentimonas sp.]|nr:endonuclease/exonuclease/phosphatase family protein [Fermentimonas sp.]
MEKHYFRNDSINKYNYMRYISSVCFILIALIASVENFTVSAQVIHVQEENSIRLMSYNIRNARGLDEMTDYQRIADVINSVAPDIIAVQELDSVTARSKGVDVLDVLARNTLMNPTYASAIDYDGGKYGVGILSKEKPLSIKKIPLPGREEPRILLIVEMDDYYFGCTHFSLTDEDRLESVEII